MHKKISSIAIVILAIIFMVISSAAAALDVPALIKNADSAITSVQTLLTSNVGGFKIGQNLSGVGEKGTVAILKNYEQYISQALSLIESLKSKGEKVADFVKSLQASNQKNITTLSGLLNKAGIPENIKSAIKSAITKAKEIQGKLLSLKNK